MNAYAADSFRSAISVNSRNGRCVECVLGESVPIETMAKSALELHRKSTILSAWLTVVRTLKAIVKGFAESVTSLKQSVSDKLSHKLGQMVIRNRSQTKATS